MARTVRPWNAATPIGYFFDSRTQARVPVFMSDEFKAWFAGLVQAVIAQEAGNYRPASEFWYDVGTGTGGGHIPPFIEGGL